MSLKKTIVRALYPKRADDIDHVDAIIRQQIVGSYAPANPPIAQASSIACIGSCFAQEMAKSLIAQGKNVAPIFLSERWATSFAVRHFIARAFDGTPLPPGYVANISSDRLDSDGWALQSSDAFIITLGLSLCWHHSSTNEMVLDVKEGHATSGILEALSSYTMKQSSVAENEEQIEAIIACIRRHKPKAPIVFTLSPIPLFLALGSAPVIPANHLSKAVLRSALNVVMERAHPDVYYWPSYDIVEWLAKYHGPVFGGEGQDLRHLKPEITARVMTFFNAVYFQS